MDRSSASAESSRASRTKRAVAHRSSCRLCAACRASAGSYVHGLFLEGARWDTEACCLGLDDAPSKELYPILPVVHIRAAAVADIKTDGLYECPVYKTLSRGATYVFSAGLRTNVPPSKWVLAGVAILMDVTERS